MWTRSLRFLAFLALVVMLMLTHAVMYAHMLLNRRGPVQSLFLLGSSPLYYYQHLHVLYYLIVTMPVLCFMLT